MRTHCANFKELTVYYPRVNKVHYLKAQTERETNSLDVRVFYFSGGWQRSQAAHSELFKSRLDHIKYNYFTVVVCGIKLLIIFNLTVQIESFCSICIKISELKQIIIHFIISSNNQAVQEKDFGFILT